MLSVCAIDRSGTFTKDYRIHPTKKEEKNKNGANYTMQEDTVQDCENTHRHSVSWSEKKKKHRMLLPLNSGKRP